MDFKNAALFLRVDLRNSTFERILPNSLRDAFYESDGITISLKGKYFLHFVISFDVSQNGQEQVAAAPALVHFTIVFL